jgi:hypothetical protein
MGLLAGWPAELLCELKVKFNWLTVEKVAIIAHKFEWAIWTTSATISIIIYYGIFTVLKWIL